MADANIEFKGCSVTLSVLHIKTANLSDIKTYLTNKIAQAPDFFHLVPIVVNIELIESAINYNEIKALIESCNFTFVGFTGALAKEKKVAIRDAGFSFVNVSQSKPIVNQSLKQAPKPLANNVTEEKASKVTLFTDKVHRGQIRSGQQLYAKNQNLVVIGSVSAGAEVIADGNIHVYGALRGRAIAGAKGHKQAQIYCQNLEAELVSINGNYWLSESIEQHWGNPVYIHLTGDELTSSALV